MTRQQHRSHTHTHTQTHTHTHTDTDKLFSSESINSYTRIKYVPVTYPFSSDDDTHTQIL